MSATRKSGGGLFSALKGLARSRLPSRVVVRAKPVSIPSVVLRPEQIELVSSSVEVTATSLSVAYSQITVGSQIDATVSKGPNDTDSATSANAAEVAVSRQAAPLKENDEYVDVEESDADNSDGSYDEDLETMETESEKEKGATKGKTKSKSRSRPTGGTKWVSKLLNQVGRMKDKVHRKRRRPRRREREGATAECHPIHRVGTGAHALLLCHVFTFLDPLVPAMRCAFVNHAWSSAVGLFNSRFSRPRAWLAQFVFGRKHPANGVLDRVLSMLPLADRVRASATSQTLRAVADAMPLALVGDVHSARFLQLVSSERIAARFNLTDALSFDSVSAAAAVGVLQYKSDGEGEEFAAVTRISIVRLAEFDSEQRFIQLVQALFTDRVSRTLRSLVISDLSLEDAHFRHLARLFYDGQFPHLEHIDLSKNAFSSRFMRDLSRSFSEDRFRQLQSIDITDVGMGVEDMERFFASLAHVSTLRSLRVAHNSCSPQSLKVLAGVLSKKMLPDLSVLNCSAISVSENGIGILLDGLRGASCSRLQLLDISGNSFDRAGHAASVIACGIAERWWPRLAELNISFTKPSARDMRVLGSALTTNARNVIRRLDIAGNGLRGDAFESLVHSIEHGGLRAIVELNLGENELGPLEFEMLAHCLSLNCCPRLQSLNLSELLITDAIGNRAGSDGLARFHQIFAAPIAQTLYDLDLSNYDIPSLSLSFLADTLMKSNCFQLRQLNLVRNEEVRSIVRFQQLIRSGKCPSLSCLQVGYAQSEAEGIAFVRQVRSRISVEELRRLKQLRFETRMMQIEVANVEKARSAGARCNRQCRLLRDMYNHMEREADRALRRRKRVRKSTDLHIREEMIRLKQEMYHERACDELDRNTRAVALLT